jgi:hypothetical protein
MVEAVASSLEHPPTEILRAVFERICAAADAKLESSGGLCGFPTEEELFASQVIYLAQDGLDRLDEIEEEAEAITQARSPHQPARVVSR